jgi:hypothetical protein
MYIKIETLKELRTGFDAELRKQRESSSEDLTQKNEDEIFAAVLAKSEIFNFGEAEIGFSVKGKILTVVEEDFFVGFGYKRRQFTATLTAEKDKKQIGQITFTENGSNSYSVSYSNTVVESMFEKKESFAIAAKGSGFVESVITSPNKAVKRFLKLYQTVIQDWKTAEKNSSKALAKLLNAIKTNPKGLAVTEFNTDDLPNNPVSMNKMLSIVGFFGVAAGLVAAIPSFMAIGPALDAPWYLLLGATGGMLLTIISVIVPAACWIGYLALKDGSLEGKRIQNVQELLEQASKLDHDAMRCFDQKVSETPTTTEASIEINEEIINKSSYHRVLLNNSDLENSDQKSKWEKVPEPSINLDMI